MLDLEAIKERREALAKHLGREPWAIERGETDEPDEDGESTGDTMPIALIGPTGHSYEGPSPVLQLVGFHDWFEAVAQFHAHAPTDIDALVAEVERLKEALLIIATGEGAPLNIGGFAVHLQSTARRALNPHP